MYNQTMHRFHILPFFALVSKKMFNFSFSAGV
jgi:hypothetical protein